MAKSKIILNMIVKDEKDSIVKCLESVKPYIDYYSISDTGSTDNTKDLIKETLSDIPGEVTDESWKDFATNRNYALTNARNFLTNLSIPLEDTYILIIDADDTLVVDSTATPFDDLTAQAYHIFLKNGSILYPRVQMLKAHLDAKYHCVLHEYLGLPAVSVENISGCHMLCGHTSARAVDPDKYKKDCLTLEKALIDEPNNDRYVFYLAQSYRDSNQLDKSYTTYLKRASMGGWIEEVFISLLEAAKIKERLYFAKFEETKKHDADAILTIENSYLAAYNTYPLRTESIAYLCFFLRKFNAFHKCYFYSKAVVNTQPPNNALFLEQGIYDWQLKDELAISAYYLGKIQEAYMINSQLIYNKAVPQHEVHRIQQNLNFCMKKMQPSSPLVPVQN